MIPGFLYDSYKRYKAGTNEFLTWLVENAPSSARLAVQPIPERKPKGPRPKGKERRAAKKQSPAKTHVVAISHIIPLAQGLVKNVKKPVKVPNSVIGILQRTIAARNECAVWFEAQAKQETSLSESVKRHSYFVGVLAKALEILEPQTVPAETGSAEPSNTEEDKSTKPTAIDNNMFADLEMEDFELQGGVNILNTHARNTDKARARAQESTQNVYEAEPSDEDMVFATYCLFQDLDRIQEYICQLWKDYRNGEVSLINASATSNTAVEVVERMEMEFFNSFPTFSDWEEVMRTLHSSRGTPGKLDPTIDVARTLNLKIFYSVPHQCLQEWCTQVYYPKGDVYDPRVDQSVLSDDEMTKRKFILLREVLFEYVPLICGPLPTEDALTKGLRKVYESKKIHIWVAFALQVFLDINCVLGSSAGDGLRELQEAGETILASLEDYISYSPTLEGIWHDDNLENLRGLSESIHECIINDSIMARRDELWGKVTFGRGKPFYLLSQHPMLCGLSKFAITLKHQQAGMVKINDQGIVLGAAHLYNAAQQDGSLATSWATMDDLITLWKSEQIYAGTKPSEPDTWYRRYRYIEGMPVEISAPNASSRGYITRKRDYREPFQYPPLMKSLLEQYCKTGPDFSGMTTEEMKLLLSKRSHDQQHANSRSNRLRRQWDRSHRLGPVQLLDVLRDWITEEEPKMLFDYFGLYKHSLQLLRSLINAMRADFQPWLGSQHINTYRAAYVLPEFIFAHCKSPDRSNRKAGKAMLQRVGKAIEVSIEVVKRQDSSLLERKKQELRKEEQEGEGETPPELSAATLWGILQPDHLTHFGKCIHIGICKRQAGSMKKEDLPKETRDSADGESLLVLDSSARRE